VSDAATASRAGREQAEAWAPDDARLDPRLREFLRERGAEPALRIQPLAGDASARRYFRILGRAPSRVVALYPEPFVPADSTFLAVRDVLATCGLPVPEILEADGPRGVLLLQDLGDETLQEVLRTAAERERDELYREALDQVVTLQREAAHVPPQAACFNVSFDLEKLSWELHYFLKHFVEGERGCDLGVEDRATLSEAFHGLAAEIASWPRVLCHRDYHSRNLMRHAGRLYWIDFQDARMGPATYDLASLLRDSYVDLDEEFVAQRLEEFRQRALPGESRDVLRRRFELMSVQRNLKALGTFGYMRHVRGSQVYLPYVPRTLAHARRNLARHPELEALRRVLARHLKELE
jgi:aminoglycoside/choline kinase family phosphotransferase